MMPRKVEQANQAWFGKWLETVRWADQNAQDVALAQAGVRSAELFRVTAPFPCTWRIICGAQCGNALNTALPLRLVINIGIGSFTTQAPFDIFFNGIFNFEMPGQHLSAFMQVNDVMAAADHLVFGAGIAPNVSPFVIPIMR